MLRLDKLGLGRKPKGYFHDRKIKEEPYERLNRNHYLKAFILLSFMIGILVILPGGSFRDISYKLGEPWRDDDLTAPFTFSLLKDREELRQAELEARTNTPSIFYLDRTAADRAEAQIQSILETLVPLFEHYSNWVNNRQNDAEQALQDSLRFRNLYLSTSTPFDDQTLDILLRSWQSTGSSAERGPSPRFAGNDLRQQVMRVIDELHNDGVLNIPKAELSIPEIILRDQRERTQQMLNTATIRDMSEARDFARFRLPRLLDNRLAGGAMELFEAVLHPNYIFNQEDTDKAIRDAIDSISPTKGAISEGQMIIRKGDLITPERLNMLQSLEAARATRASDFELWQQHAGNAMVFIAIFFFYIMYIYLYRNPIFGSNAKLTLILLANGLVLVFSIFIIRLDGFSIYMVPVAIAPIILTIIFDSRVGLMTTSTLALSIAFMSGNNFEFAVASITAGSIAVYSVRDIKNRSQFFLTTPALVFITYGFVLIGFTLIKPGGWQLFGNQLLFVAGSCILIWLTYPLILLFEKVFKVTTEVSLLELNSNNHPLLKALMTRAPGTFQHSLQVANLAEAAASAINANSLLCRVGALYHDIGKMEKPEYFVENQFGENEHDKLKPRMSAMVIRNHVTAGVKMAEEAKLPNVIIDFIKTHHGNSIIKYFYEKAKQELAEKENEVREEDYRYSGPIPNSKETGILLLADCVEASSRAMSEPSYQKLENLINRMIDERLEEGQLNNCDLTLRDLRIIKESFLGIMVGVYHSRVKYPGQDQKDNQGLNPKGSIEIHQGNKPNTADGPSGSD
jgi:cyclic-di-AMP phosphodiesterase PgpH